MNIIRMNKTSLLKKVKANREDHKKDYEEAVIGHRKAVIELLELNLKTAKNGGLLVTHISLPIPITKVNEYDRAIAMFENSVDTIIELSTYEFDCYMLDNWDWKAQTMFTNSTYKALK